MWNGSGLRSVFLQISKNSHCFNLLMSYDCTIDIHSLLSHCDVHIPDVLQNSFLNRGKIYYLGDSEMMLQFRCKTWQGMGKSQYGKPAITLRSFLLEKFVGIRMVSSFGCLLHFTAVQSARLIDAMPPSKVKIPPAKIIYPDGCKELAGDLSKDEIIKRLVVRTSFLFNFLKLSRYVLFL